MLYLRVSAIKSTDKSSPYHGLSRDISSIRTTLHPPRSHFLPAVPTPGTSSSPTKFAAAAPDGNIERCLPSSQPLLSWPAHHDVTVPFDGLLEEV